MTGVSALAVSARKLPPYLQPWRYLHHDADRSGIGSYTLSPTAATSSLLSAEFYASPVLTAGPSQTKGTVETWYGHAVIGGTDSILHSYAFNGTGTGTYSTPTWSYTLGGAIYSTAAIGNLHNFDTIYVGCDDDKVYQFNYDGTLQATYTTGGAVRSSPALDEQTTATSYLVVGSNDDKVYGLTIPGLGTGWTFTTGGAVVSSPAIDTANGYAYVGSDDDKLYCLYERGSSAGTLKWSFLTGGVVEDAPLLTGSLVVFGSADEYVYALSAGTGTSQWSYKTGGAVYSGAAVSSSGNTVYIGSDDGKLYALNASNGALDWTYATGGVIRSSPAILSDGRIAFGSDDGHVYVLTSSGTLSTSYATTTAVRSSPAVGYPNNTTDTYGNLFFATITSGTSTGALIRAN